ncbi:spermatogenesis-associated protein 24-like [Amphiura filiformis]|uniref:spermatogenesis-associated protein 24-like n=1 Tax=Amphiura filiformis TaxID=82378 RepID=UPI003B21AC03
MDESMQRTDILVHKQLQDLLLAQRQAFEAWKEESLVDQETMVSRCQYEVLAKQLEDEKLAHIETQAKLADVSDKLQFALGEIEILTKQLKKEKATFDASFGKLQQEVDKESCKSIRLQSRCTVISEEKEKQDDLLHFKDSKIRDLKQRLAKQKECHQKQMEEVNIQLQQEAYIAKMLTSDKGRKQGTTGKT